MRCKTCKMIVVNGQRKGLMKKKDQVCMQEMNANESLKKYRNTTCRTKLPRTKGVRKSITATCLLVMRPPVHRRHDLHTGFITEHGISAEGKMGKYPIAAEVGQNHSSAERYGNISVAKDSGYWSVNTKQQPERGGL